MNSLPILHELTDTSIIASRGSNPFSDLYLSQSSSKTTPKLLNHLLFRWSKSRRAKVMAKNNVCVIMKSEQNTRILNQNQQNSITECYSSQTSMSPAVSFINRDEGLVSMQIMDRILINDNQLYSMAITSEHQNNYNQTSNNEYHCKSLKSSPLYQTNDCLKDKEIECKDWFYGSMERQKAIEILEKCSIGSFIIRYSTTQSNSFALTLRVPNDYHFTGIAHYLIVRNDNNFLKIKGFTKEFETLESLVIHHSVMKELLPCHLLLPDHSLNQKYSKYLPNNQSKKDINKNEDILVDIDSDPNYQKILINFRKTMVYLN